MRIECNKLVVRKELSGRILHMLLQRICAVEHFVGSDAACVPALMERAPEHAGLIGLAAGPWQYMAMHIKAIA